MSERITYFADVLMPLPVHEVFTYRVPFEMNSHVLFGQRVIVPFGKSKLLTGVIVSIHQNIPKNYQAKYIEYILDECVNAGIKEVVLIISSKKGTFGISVIFLK